MRFHFLAALVLSLASLSVHAQSWTVEAYLGNAYNLGTRLNIRQDGGYDQSLKADYETRGFRSPLYYAIRGSRWRSLGDGAAGWEVQLVHHKLYLENPPAGVASLSISHGYNILTFNGAWRTGNWIYRFGAGPVITHAEGTINNVSYNGGYKLSGAAMIAGLGRRFYFGKQLFLSAEGMASAAYAKPKMDGTLNAELKASNIALHGLAGLGYEF
jgi:hypothetical protein